MYKVLQFFIERINFFTFLLLEILAFVLIINNNPYQSASFFNSSNAMMGNLLNLSNRAKEYLNLAEINNSLASENAQLKTLLSQKYMQCDPISHAIDTIVSKKYHFVAAKVINNSTFNMHNYFTINKGFDDSIRPGMGVVNKYGVVGKIKSCSKHFATASSLLHKEIMVSSKHKKSGNVCTVRWEGKDAFTASAMYLPRHVQVKIGDTLVTSGYNAVFPENQLLGTIKSLSIKPFESFYTAEINVSNDFTKLNYVYVIKNKLLFEQDTLEQNLILGK